MSITVIKEGAQEGKVPTGPRTVTPGPVHRGKHAGDAVYPGPRETPGDPGPGSEERGAWCRTQMVQSKDTNDLLP